MEAGDSPAAGFMGDLNRLLLEYPYLDQVVDGKSGLVRRKRFTPELPEHVFAPLADAIAGLLTNVTKSRIRKCRNCVLHFHDTSKKGTRLWCSMNLCGNRSKVAAYAERKRAAAEDE
jgi:predicted RNA-binding Zn ribbon-like protein